MDTKFMISRNSKTSDPQRLLLNLLGKINLKRKDKYVALSNLAFTIHGQNIKNYTEIAKLNISSNME